MPRVRPVRRGATGGGARRGPSVTWHARLEDHVIGARASADGRLVAAASISGPVALLDAVHGTQVAMLAGHDHGTASIDWSPVAPVLASGGHDGRVMLWGAGSGAPAGTLGAGSSWVERVRWSPDGALLAAAAGRRVTLWRADGAVVAEWTDHPSTVTDIAWSPDGSLLAATSYGGVSLWSIERPDPVRLEWIGSSLALAWSPTGRHLATGDQDATVHFWDVMERSDLQMSGYPTKVRELAWDATGRHLATGGGVDVTVWDCAPPGPEGSLPAVAEGDGTQISALAAHPVAELIAAGSHGGRLFLFRPLGAAARGRIELGAGVSVLAWLADGRRLVAGTGAGDVVCLQPG
jgi:WD40 repeat protein